MRISRKELLMFVAVGIILIMIPFLITENIPSKQIIFKFSFFKKMMLDSV